MTNPPVPPAAPVYQPVPMGPKTNTMAIVGFILAFVVSVVGVVLSFVALSQIKKTGEGGHGLALAGVIVGFVVTFFWVIYFIVVIAALAFEGAAVGSLTNY